MSRHDRYCPRCGRPTAAQVPEGDHRERRVCTACGVIHYDNPRVVVGSVAYWEDKVLLVRRAIDPRVGFWTLPAGFLEDDETAEEGARREAEEEARADLAIRHLLGVYSLPHIAQVQLIYLADLVRPDVAAGPESLEVGLFAWNDIPWDDLAFPTVHWALRYADQVRAEACFVPERRTRGPGFDPPPATG